MALAVDMTGKVALVTGAASGLGRGTALALARAGADLCIVDVNPAGLEETAAAIRVLGRKVLVHTTDLSDAANCPPAVAVAVREFGHLDALCNVAGLIMFTNTPEMSVAHWNKTIAVNLSAPFHLCQAAIPHLLARDGAIVNVSSTAAYIGEAYAAAYCASKAGLLQMTKALAMEYQKKSIRINAIAPGGMMTNIADNLVMPEGVDYELIKRFSGMRGLVEVDDVSEMIAILASDAGRGFHGSCITMDRGITAG
ncbi:SDR family NAD(P)-dependent oxidoreductase [Acidocella sp.]|uniref:SDR family NAD(P)-dependent oxidoreductase n=1 Tax=Acidocella sp. TaxID=50710 RepID=UPI00262D7035|nr:SDR family NAD(P)-dependent oxidoreductase [Acidocella sp.]